VKIFRNKTGEMGIGTLVLFIAMILVAAIAAGVLVQTAVTLQSRALETGKRSTTEVSSALKTVLLYGEDASVNRSIQFIRQHVKLVSGSDPIKFNDSVITLDLSDEVLDYNFDYYRSCENVSGPFYAIRYIKNGTNNKFGYASVGDIMELCYEAPRQIMENEFLRVNFIPKSGSIMTVRVMTPDAMITRRIFLYP
jgi:archaellin